MKEKITGEIRKKEYQLEPAQCQNRTDLQGFECHDHYLNGVTYRVWSVFEGRTNAAKSLSTLMLRKLESGEEVGEVEDGFEEMIRRKFKEAEEYCEENHLLTPEFTEQFKRLTATC